MKNLWGLPESVNFTIRKQDLIDLVNICLTKGIKQNAKVFLEHLNIKQLSEYLNYSEPAIYKMVAHAEIPYYKLSGKLLFKRTEIDDWLLNFRQPTTKERFAELDNKGR